MLVTSHYCDLLQHLLTLGTTLNNRSSTYGAYYTKHDMRVDGGSEQTLRRHINEDLTPVMDIDYIYVNEFAVCITFELNKFAVKFHS